MRLCPPSVARLLPRVVPLTALVPAVLAGQPGRSSGSGAVAITGVTVIDVERGRRVPGQTVVIVGPRIAAMGAGVAAPRGARVVDGRGRYLIPGLWDMHVHALPRERRPRALETFFPLFVAHGVTGVRDMGDILDTLRAVRARGFAGGPAAPRLVAAGPLVDGPRPAFPDQSVAVAGPADAPRVVDSLAAAGVDFVKAYSRLPRATFFAVAAAARRRRLPIAGHVPVEVSVAEASDSGLRSIEHLAELVVDCSANAPAIRAAWADALRDAPAGGATLNASRRTARAQALRQVDWTRCEGIAERLARNGTWVTPTLVTGLAAADSSRPRDPRLRYFEPATVAAWREEPRPTPVAPDRSPVPGDSGRQPIRADAAGPYVHMLARAGVGLLAGTDTPSGMAFPGFDLHEELAQLVAVGLSPLEALRAATLNPARFLGATDSLGTVARGKLADLVLLDGDPLVDVRNTTRIRAVVAGGRYYDRAALDALLAGVERAAGGDPGGRDARGRARPAGSIDGRFRSR